MGNLLSCTGRTHQMDSTIEPLEKHILKTLDKLGDLEFEMFKLHLRHPDVLEGEDPIPKRPLKKAGKRTTAHLMVRHYSSDAVQTIVVNVLKNIHRNELVERFPDISQVVTSEQHEATDADPPTTSTTRGVSTTEVVTSDQHEATDADPPSSTSTSTKVSTAEASVKHFIDQRRRVLIEKVTNVESILDVLLEEGVITKEGYDNVLSKATNQEKMRKLYTLMNSRKAKDMFYKGLEEYEKSLLDDLVQASPPSLSATPLKGAAAAVSELLVKTGHYITEYEEKLQGKMSKTYLPVKLDNEPKMKFEDVYVPLYNVNISFTEIHKHHEVRQMEMNKAGEKNPVKLSEIFKDPSGINEKTLLTVGVAGIGKTFLLHKFVFDWANNCFPQDPHLLFPFKFRELNLLEGKNFSLAELIHECIKETRFIEDEDLNVIFNTLQKSDDYNSSPFKVMFVFDGLDENQLQLNLDCLDCLDPNQSYPVEVLLANLINGELFPSAHIWITSRPAAAAQIPEDFVDRMTEVRGFTDKQKEEYFKKKFRDENQASSMTSLIISHINKSKVLSTMSEIPIFCWITAKVVQDIGTTGKLPETLVEMYCQFLMVQTKRKKEKFASKRLFQKNKQKLIEAEGEVLLKLGKLAFDQLVKGNIMFYEKDLNASGLDVNKDLMNSGMCTAFFKVDGACFQETVYCFVHLSIQEFLAAVYLYHCFTQRNMNVLKTFLGYSYNSDSSLSGFLKAAMKIALKSENGHLDLFARFLHGLSLESNQSLLGGLLGQTKNSPEEIQRAINNLKEMKDDVDDDISPDRCINIFHCLMEMKDPSVSQGIQQYLESESRSGKQLSEIQCSALASMLQMSEKVLDELDLNKYNTSKEGRWRLVPAVRNCTTARLVDCHLKEEHIEVVASALSSDPSHLRELDLSGNGLDVSGLELICAGLKSPHCCLDILRLNNCALSERCCEVLSSALTSNPSLHLRELDLTLNMVTESGMKTLLSLAGLKNLQVTHGGEDRFNPHLIKGYYHPLTLDTNTAHWSLSLSEDNRKVTLEVQDHRYAPHPDRFDGHMPKVLCSEGLTGHCYWEVEWGGYVSIAVTDRGISRKGEGGDCQLGYNDMSWSLECRVSNSYIVIHNSKETRLPVSSSRCSNRVAVYLDCSAGTLSFYKISEDILIHLFTFRDTFTEPLYAGFYVRNFSSSVFLCEQR